MNELPNIDSIKIPLNPSREWIWNRILISIDFSILKKPTALQWALLKVLLNIETVGEISTEQVAEKLAVEKSIIDEGLTNLIEEKLVVLQPRKKADQLQNFKVEPNIDQPFKDYELIPQPKETKKIILFYDYKDERTYSYQIVEKYDEDDEEELDESFFELVLLGIIEQLWKELENNPHTLVGEIDLPLALEHPFIKDLQSVIIEKISINFL